MIFHNRFVSQDELAEFLSAADIYITPYLKPEQITSGTLAYAVGAGKAVISTPYLYARELLADGRGVLVPWRDPAAIAREVIGLLGDDDRRRSLCARAAALRPRHDLAGGRAPIRRELRARASRARATASARRSARRRSPRGRPDCPRSTSSTCT